MLWILIIMMIGIYCSDYSIQSLKFLRRILNDYNIKHLVNNDLNDKSIDFILVLGGDKAVRNYFHKSINSDIPILGINDSEESGFLSQIELKEFISYIGRIKNNDYTVENIPRIGVKIDRKNFQSVLNDVAVFPSKCAVLMEHILRINNEEVWHDSSDGIIVSTPLGSSAYSMSAGGPIIFNESPVFGIVSVNSLNITRRPLIVSNSSHVLIDDISARLHCEVILDGLTRYKVKKTVECTKYLPSAHIIRMKKNSTTITALEKKVHLAKDLLKMPPSSKLLLKTMEYEGMITQKELARKTLLPLRTVRLSLRQLLEKGYIKTKISTRDSRQKTYEIS